MCLVLEFTVASELFWEQMYLNVDWNHMFEELKHVKFLELLILRKGQ